MSPTGGGLQFMLPKITDYWDTTQDACNVQATRLTGVTGATREYALTMLTEAVTEHVAALDNDLLVLAAVAVADDLYKAANRIDRWDKDVNDYLQATAAAFWSAFSERGFTLRYLADNTFSDLARPLQLFPLWFSAAGLVYVCPQAVAAEIIRSTVADDAPISDLLSSHIREARDVVQRLLQRCQEETRNLILLDLDFDQGYLDLFWQPGRQTLTLFRSEAPEPGTKIATLLPESSGEANRGSS